MSAHPAKKAKTDDMEGKADEQATTSWVAYDAATCDFPIQNLPYGVFSNGGGAARCGVAIGDQIFDLAAAHAAGLFDGSFDSACFATASLNAFMGQGRGAWTAARAQITALLAGGAPAKPELLVPQADAEMTLPCEIGDYTDFYSSRQHATNVGTMFRDPDNALLPNWSRLPVGYHGRASSVVPSGVALRRPRGQLQLNPATAVDGSKHAPCRLLDFELEMGAIVGTGNALGDTISMENADDHIFGFVLMNDWSARDIQKFEYVPLGPFGAKNFGTTISPWVVPLDAMKPFEAPTSFGGPQDPVPLDYLVDPDYCSFDVKLEVAIRRHDQDAAAEPHVVSRSNFLNMYWNHRQQLVHHTVTGCNMRTGDLLGSGTISGEDPTSWGSLLELCWKGTKQVVADPPFPEGKERKFLQDGDEVLMRGFCTGDGFRIGFGPCDGKILPAHTE